MSQSNLRSHDVLRDEILADAQRQATRLTRKAERDAQAIVDKAKADSEQERAARLSAAEAAAEHQRRLTMATLPVEIGRLRALRLERELTALGEQIQARLLARQGYAYDESLVTLATEAIAHMEGNHFVLALARDDLLSWGSTLPAAVRQRVGRSEITVTVDAEPAPIIAGVLVRDAEGRQYWDNSLDARLRRMWPVLRSKIAEQLGLHGRMELSGDPS